MAVDLSEITELEQLITLMKAAGVERLLFKRLSPNDNSKNQIYLGGNYSALQNLPLSDITADTSSDGSKNNRFKATITLQWLDEDGSLYNAPNSQLILYPSYPEVRLSGFLSKASKRPSRLLGSRDKGRILFLGSTHDGKIVGHVISADNTLNRDLENFKDKGERGVLIEIPMPETFDGEDNKSNSKPNNVFKPRARILQLLGDELIGSPRLAVFELVKNAYDADASRVSVRIESLNSDKPYLSVRDNGSGMTEETLRNIWLVLAHDHRGVQKKSNTVTAKGRLPLGEKGLGRLAVHKLGDVITLHTRAANDSEYKLVIDWRKLAKYEYLEDAVVDIQKLSAPEKFKNEKTGTYIKISKLRGKAWTRGEVRRLYRQIQSISSPIPKREDDFKARLKVPEYPEWISNLEKSEDILKRAPWEFNFSFKDGFFRWSYDFSSVSGTGVPKRNIPLHEGVLLLPPPFEGTFGVKSPEKRTKQRIVADKKFVDEIGPITGKIYAFDRDPAIISQFDQSTSITSFLDEQGGLRVYRDDIRVYNYGERNDDWLNLDIRRVNTPSKNLSRNLIFGWIDLELRPSVGLIEKTNREGFVENEYYENLRRIVLGAIAIFETERNQDKALLREALTIRSKDAVSKLDKPLDQLTKEATRLNVIKTFKPIINQIRVEYDEMKVTSARIGLSGLGLAVVFHEVEQGVRGLYKDMKAGVSSEDLLVRARRLMKMLDGFADLLRKGEVKKQSLNKLIRRARNVSRLRFRFHKTKLWAPSLEEDFEDVKARYTFPLLLGTMTNLLDNCFYWIGVQAEKNEDPDWSPKIFIDIDSDAKGYPRLLVADNGPGFSDSPEKTTKAFFSRRPEGIGLGLYFVKMAMEVNGGYLDFPSLEETELPSDATGAIVGLVFGDGNNV